MPSTCSQHGFRCPSGSLVMPGRKRTRCPFCAVASLKIQVVSSNWPWCLKRTGSGRPPRSHHGYGQVCGYLQIWGQQPNSPLVKGWIPYSPAVATKHAWTAGSKAFGWNTLHNKPREQLTQMKHTAWIQVPRPKSPIATKVKRNLHKSHNPSTH